MELKNVDPETNAPVLAKKGTFPATVAKVIDDYKLVINKGSEDGIREGQRMLIYRVSDEEIKDPNTGESLGYLELVRGTGKIIFVQEKLSMLETDRKQVNRRTMISAFSSEKIMTEYDQLVPFENPQVGDQVKPI